MVLRVHIEEKHEPRQGWYIAPAEQEPVQIESDETASVEDSLEQTSERSSVALMLLGVFGGLFLLYSLGWIEISRAYADINQLTAAGSGMVGAVLQNILFWLAPIAPAAWLVTAITFAKQTQTLKLAILLLMGAVVLFPFPFIFAGGTA